MAIYHFSAKMISRASGSSAAASAAYRSASRLRDERLDRHHTDTRDLAVQGGNPIASAHATACRRAGIADFRVHDWRHHWASHCVMAGIDLVTIMKLGGWTSLRMVVRYAAVDTSHMHQAILKLV